MKTACTVYFDDSGHPANDDALIVAGWVSTSEQWQIFETEWKEFLVKAGIKSAQFHMTDFEARYPGSEYAALDERQRLVLLDQLITTIKVRIKYGFCAIVPIADYKNVNEIYALEECFGKPYALAGRHAVGQSKEWSEKYNRDSQLPATVFESGTLHKGDLMDILARDDFDPPIFENKKDTTALQAADLFAWECFSTFKTNVIRPSLMKLLNLPHGKAMFSQETLIENCEEFAVPKRIPGIEFDVRIAGFKNKPRRRRILGASASGQITGRDRL